MNDKPKPAIEMITLKQLCAELKVDPREARERLRLAVRDAKKNPELQSHTNQDTPGMDEELGGAQGSSSGPGHLSHASDGYRPVLGSPLLARS